jgi:uncharacterized protein YkwD
MFMTTLLLRSIVRFYWFLSLLVALLVAAPLWSPTPAHAAADDPRFRILLPLVLTAPPTIAITATAESPAESQVVALTNELRQQHGCPPLIISPALSAAAQTHSQEMAEHNYFSHIDLNGHSSNWRAQQAGYIGSAGWENIAAGYPTAEAVVTGWYNETPPNDGHRRNLLNCALTEIGVGATTNPQSDYDTYWTQDFGQR